MLSSLRGVYTVAVQGRAGNPMYSLTFTTGYMKFLTVQVGVPLDVQIEPNQAAFLVFRNRYMNSPFKIVVTKETGSATIAVNTFDIALNDYADHLPSPKTRPQFTNKDKAGSDLLRIEPAAFLKTCETYFRRD